MPQAVSAISVADLLTSASVACAAATLVYTWIKDRQLRVRDYADKVRAAASLTLSKIERCQSLFQSIGDRAQRAATEADQIMVTKKDALACRDFFWAALHDVRTAILVKYHDEEIEMAYAPLLVYRSDIYAGFTRTLRAAHELEVASFWILQDRCQIAILEMDPAKAGNAATGNALRNQLARHDRQYGRYLTETFAPVREWLLSIVKESDSRIVKGGCTPPLAVDPALADEAAWEKRFRREMRQSSPPA